LPRRGEASTSPRLPSAALPPPFPGLWRSSQFVIEDYREDYRLPDVAFPVSSFCLNAACAAIHLRLRKVVKPTT
jgi:hypothetical protein